MKTFKEFNETKSEKELDIKDLEKMIKKPDPSRFKQYGGKVKYIKMLKGKLAKLKESAELEEAKKVIAQVELWSGKKMKKSFKNQSSAEKFIKKMQDEEDVRGYNMYAEDSLEEAAYYIDTSPWSYANAGKKPKGKGMWAFEYIASSGSGGTSGLQKDRFFSKAMSTYKDAVKQLSNFLKKELGVKPKDVKIKVLS